MTDKIQSPNNRLVEIDMMKFYGIILVVIGHVATTYLPTSLIRPKIPSEFICNLKDIIYAFHMPMFIFVSGCVFAYQLEIKKKKISFVSLLKNKFKRLMIPFYVFGFLWVLPVMVILGFRDPFHYAIDGFILAIDPRHLWFVMTLFWIFLLFYGLKFFSDSLHMPSWIILPIAVALYFLPIKHISYLQIGNVFNYFLWFSLGYFFILKRQWWGILLGTSIIVLALSYIYQNPIIASIKNIAVAIIGISAMYIVSKYTQGIRDTFLYKTIGDNSFGIYLFHAMIIYILEYMFSPYPINPLLLSIVIFSISLVLSVLLTIFVRRAGAGIIIGEKK